MDTFEARLRMRDLATEALAIVGQLEASPAPGFETVVRVRQMVVEARGILPDAGYPGEAAWHGLQRASIGMDTLLDDFDRLFWADVVEELERGVETLSSLVSPRQGREVDLRIVG